MPPRTATEEIVKTPYEVRRIVFWFGRDLIPGTSISSGTVTPSSGDITIESVTPDDSEESLVVMFSGGLVTDPLLPYKLTALATVSNGEKLGCFGLVHVVAEKAPLLEMAKTADEERLMDFDFSLLMFEEEAEEITVADIQAPAPVGTFTVGPESFSGMVAQAEARAGNANTENTVRARVETSLGQKLEGFLLVKVVS
jgi:hypothetical protein